FRIRRPPRYTLWHTLFHYTPLVRSWEVVFLLLGLVEEQGSPQQVFENPLSARCKQFMSSNR
ncbi:hypothetical protein ACI2KL_17025, partial [Pseudomonas yamanorum]